MTAREAGELQLLAVLTLPGVERSVRHARLFLRDTLVPDHLSPGDEVLDDMLLVVDEFAVNAIRHTSSGRGGQIHIALRIGEGMLRAEVSDDGAGGARPALRYAGDGESGRGLHVLVLPSGPDAVRRGRCRGRSGPAGRRGRAGCCSR